MVSARRSIAFPWPTGGFDDPAPLSPWLAVAAVTASWAQPAGERRRHEHQHHGAGAAAFHGTVQNTFYFAGTMLQIVLDFRGRSRTRELMAGFHHHRPGLRGGVYNRDVASADGVEARAVENKALTDLRIERIYS
jgi:hypothetical protein